MKIQAEPIDDNVKPTRAEIERAQTHAFTPMLRAITQASDAEKERILARARQQFLRENPDGLESIRVRSAKTEPEWDGSRRALLWERHPLYDGGEIFLKCEPGQWDVYLTEKVKSLLRSGALIQVYSR